MIPVISLGFSLVASGHATSNPGQALAGARAASRRRAHARRLGDRVLEGMREVGILLIAFAPLDAVLAENREARSTLLLFLALGGFLFAVALIIEWRWGDDH